MATASSSSYYSPDSILTDAQKAPCTFELDVPHLAALNAGSAIQTGSTLELPMWMAEMLSMSKPAGPSTASLAAIDMPSALHAKVINALRAGPKSVDLRAQAQWFYGLGEKMLELFEDDDVTDILLETFKQRALEIADKAQNSRQAQQGWSGDEFLKGLDEAEVQLFRAAHEGTRAVRAWEVEASSKT